MHGRDRHHLRRRVVAALVAVVAFAAAWSSVSTVDAAPPTPVDAVTAPCVDIGVDYATGDEAVERLGDDIDVAAEIVDMEPVELRDELREDDTLAVDRCGRSFYIEPATTDTPEALPQATGGDPAAADLPLPAGVSTDDAFRLHSKPGAVRTIHLDFDGAFVPWDNGWADGFNDGASFTASPYSLDGDPTTFSVAERNAIIQIWAQVAEDYAPFDVDVTTEDPGFDGAERTSSADTRYGSWAVVSNDIGPGGADCDCGGIAYVDVFDLVGGDYYRPAFVFAPQVSFDTKNIAEAVSHEVGHNLGLRHDGLASPVAEYYTGRGAWAPIMGVGYNRPVVQWSNGDYTNANRTEDDVALIAANGSPAVTDDHGDTTAVATDLGATLPVGADGVIGARGDVDVFKVTVPGGATTFRVQPTGTSPNLDAKLFVYNADGVELGSNDPAVAFVNRSTATGLDASLTLTLDAGDHYLAVDGVGWGTADTGYSDYGSLGAYGVAVTTDGGPAVTTATLPGTVTGVAYRRQLTAVGGTAPSTWAVTAGALPDGLELSSTGLLRGTPTTATTATFTVTVTDAAARSASRSFTVEPAVEITSADPPDARRSNVYSTTLAAAGGTAPYTWTLASGTLPSGLSLSTGGVISGTPTSNTTAVFVVQVTDAEGRVATRSTRLTVVTTLTVGSIAAQDVIVGEAVSLQATATGGRPVARTWTLASGALPPGVTFDDTGLVSGTATTEGSYEATLQVDDLAGNTATRAVSFTVALGTPVAVDDAYTVVAGSTLNVAAPGVLGNDSDPDGDGFTAQLVSTTTDGTLTLNANGSFTYTPTAGFRGTDSFTYRAVDDFDNASDPATVTITVQNRAPVAAPDSYATPAASPLVVAAPGVLGNDSDPDGDAFTAEVVDAPTNGTLSLAADGSFTYTPDAGFRGDDVFTYRARDALGAGSSAVAVELTVTNRVPSAVADELRTPAATTLVVTAPGVLDNDTDPDGDALNSTVVTQPSHGTLLLFADGALLYTPVTGFRGTDSFTYRAVDAFGGQSAPATVTIDVENRPPVALDDAYDTDPDTPLVVDAPGVLANDTDPDDDALTAEVVTSTAHGTLALAADGSFTYTPDPGFRGDDGFTYVVRDPDTATSDAATVTITVNNAVPVAVADAFDTPAGTPLVVAAPGLLGNDIDGDGDTLVVEVVTQPSHGTLTASTDGSFTYTPDVGFRGDDGFTYRARDPFGASSSAVAVTIEVTNRPPVAVDDAYATDAGAALQVDEPGVLGNDGDPDGDTVTAEIATQPANGTVVLDGDGGFVYTPDAGFRGTDDFTYRAVDTPGDRSAPATVTVTVRNRAPTAAADSYSTPAGTQLAVETPGVLGNDGDPDGDALDAEVVSPPTNGTLVLAPDGAFVYTPAAGFRGADSFTYRARDALGAVSAAALVAVNVTNRAPTAVDDDHTTPAGTPLVVDAPGLVGNDTDPDGDTLSPEVVTEPANGSVVANADGAFTYTPAAGFRGTDSFTYRARDAFGALSSPATVTVTVTNRPPDAADDAYTVDADTVLDVAAPGVLANDADPDGDDVTLTLVTDVTNGTLTLDADGSFAYTPTVGFAGTDTFTYRLTDAFTATTTATVTITVRSRDPVAADDTYSTPAATALVVAAPGVLGNDTGPDGVTLTAQIVTAPTSGTVTLDADGAFTYTPAAGFRGTATFTYRTIGDGTTQSSPATVTVTVTNRAPSAISDGYSLAADSTLTVPAPGLLGNDSDPDGDTLDVEVVTQPAGGTVTVGTGGAFSFTPQIGFWGVDQFTYRVRDPSGAESSPATVTLSVTPAQRRWRAEDLDGDGLSGDGRASTSTVGADPSSVLFGGRPHVFYRDDTTDRLRHGWWTGVRWQFEDLDGPGVPGGFGRTAQPIAHGTSTVLFAGTPHVFYGDATGRLRHGWWTGVRWQFEDLDGPGVPGGFGRLGAALDGRIDASLYGTLPHVYYRDADNGDLRHGWWTGARWQFETLDGAGGPEGRTTASVGADVDVVYFGGAPHAFYRDDTNGRLRHGWWTGRVWRFEDLDGAGVPGGNGRTVTRTGGSVAVTLFGGTPHVWYANDDGSALRHAWWNGLRWTFESNDTAVACGAGCGVGGDAVVTFERGLPVVFHTAAGRDGLRRSFWDGTVWRSAFFDGPDAPQVDGRIPVAVGGRLDTFTFGAGSHLLYSSPDTGRLRHAWFS